MLISMLKKVLIFMQKGSGSHNFCICIFAFINPSALTNSF